MPESDSSRHTHNMCERCWTLQEPGRWPTRYHDPDRAYLCCFCGGITWAGIFVRDMDDPGRCQHDSEIVRQDVHVNGGDE